MYESSSSSVSEPSVSALSSSGLSPSLGQAKEGKISRELGDAVDSAREGGGVPHAVLRDDDKGERCAARSTAARLAGGLWPRPQGGAEQQTHRTGLTPLYLLVSVFSMPAPLPPLCNRVREDYVAAFKAVVLTEKI